MHLGNSIPQRAEFEIYPLNPRPRNVFRKLYISRRTTFLVYTCFPSVLCHAAPHGQKSNGRPSGGALAAIKFNDIEAGSIVSSSSAVSAMEVEEKELRERLIVLEEQKFFVSEMVANATKHRRFDEVSSLAQNIEDLNKEIDQINGQLGQLDFAAAYQRDMVSPPPAG
jgi:rabenosyn-5